MRKLLGEKNGVIFQKEEHGGKVWYNVRVIEPTKVYELISLEMESNFLGIPSYEGARKLFSFLSKKGKIDNTIYGKLPMESFERDREGFTPEYVFGNLDKIKFFSPAYSGRGCTGPFLGINTTRGSEKRSIKFIYPELHKRTGDSISETIIHEDIHGEHYSSPSYSLKNRPVKEEIDTLKESVRRLIDKGLYYRNSRNHVFYAIAELCNNDYAQASRILKRVENSSGLKGKKERYYNSMFVSLPEEVKKPIDPKVSDKDWVMERGLWDLTDETYELKGFKELGEG